MGFEPISLLFPFHFSEGEGPLGKKKPVCVNTDIFTFEVEWKGKNTGANQLINQSIFMHGHKPSVLVLVKA